MRLLALLYAYLVLYALTLHDRAKSVAAVKRLLVHKDVAGQVVGSDMAPPELAAVIQDFSSARARGAR